MDIAFDPMLAIFVSLACLWAVFQGFKVVTGAADIGWIATQFVFLFFGFGVLMALQYGLAGQVYEVTYNVMFGIPASIMGGGSGSNAVVELVSGIETAFMRPINMAKSMMDSAGFFDKVGYVIFTGLIMLPFILMMIVFVTQVAIGLFRIMITCLFAPYIISLSAFPWGREQIMNGVRTLLGAIITLVAVTLVFSLIVKGVESLVPSGDGIGTDLGNADTWSAYIVVILTAWSGVALIQEAVSLAGTIAQASLNAATSGAMMSGIGGMASSYMKGGGAAFKAGKAAIGVTNDALGDAAHSMSKQYSSGNAPKSQATDALKSEK
ncbi:type IV secretion system protein [Pseudovibrio sp. Alg231-02]|uniref:type IV secretion system protein n=1 Tax=Pseudovibrio sp. Alg231-02 TaxID=1922223 RepID=UPI00131EE7BD|nr:type IV secretion system protein [Pseudovibrio sp. Alg231-02]